MTRESVRHARPAKTQTSLRIRAVWLKSLLHTRGNFTFLAIQKEPSADSECAGDLNLRWAHMSEGMFSDVAALIGIYRSYWIRWKWRDEQNKYTVYVGLCNDPRKNRLLDTGKVKKFQVKIYHVYISTSSGSTGQWQFASGNAPVWSKVG